MGVVYFHFALKTAPEAPLINLGQFGVDLFFVLSGFIMWTTVHAANSQRKTTPGAFLLRRVIRIAPIYWMMTIIAASIDTDPVLSIGYSGSLSDFLCSIFFIPAWNAKTPDMVAPILIVGWTLNLEMLFYALFAAGLSLPQQYRLPVIGAILTAASVAGIFITSENAIVSAYTNTIVIEFLFGMGLGALWVRNRLAMTTHIALSLIFAGLFTATLATMLLDEALLTYRGFIWGPAAAFIVTGFLGLEKLIATRPISWLKRLGDASYSLYLTHGMALSAMTALTPPFVSTMPPALLLPLQITAATGAGVCIYYWLEKPATAAAKRLLQGRQSDRKLQPEIAPIQ